MIMQPSHAAILLVAFACGCHGGVFAKRQSEENCPTDIRKTVPCYPGEDAVFRCPCGPSGNFYGHRPTCWRTWPAPAEVWRDGYCGPTVIEHSSTASHPYVAPEAIMSAPEPTLAPQALPPLEGTPPVTEPPVKSQQTMPVPFPGLPPLPGPTTEVERPGPKFVTAKSAKRSSTAVKQEAASANAKATENQATHDATGKTRELAAMGQARDIVQPVALEASSVEPSEVKLIASELAEADGAALATFESVPAENNDSMGSVEAAPVTSVPPASRPAQSTPRPRMIVPGFVR